jgi:hypothetical protein
MSTKRRSILAGAGIAGSLVFGAPTIAAQEKTPPSVYIVPKIGLRAGGTFTRQLKCSGSTRCSSLNTSSIDLDDKSEPGFGADVLFPVTPKIRVGGGLFYVTETKAEYQGRSGKLGTDMSLHGIVEGVFPVSPVVSFTVRAQLGLLMLFPGGDLKDEIDSNKRLCGSSCSVDDGPYKAFTYGVGGGVLVDVGGFGLRGDVLYQAFTSMTVEKVSGGGAEASYDVSGHRIWLLVGGDIGL